MSPANRTFAQKGSTRNKLAIISKMTRQLIFSLTLFIGLTIFVSCGQSSGKTNTPSSTTSQVSAAKNDSSKIDSLIHLATASDSIIDLHTSIKYYTEILNIDSIKLIALINRGRALIALGQIDKGFTDYNKAVKHYPHEETYYLRGMAYIMIRDYKNAFPDFAAAAAINPKFGKAYYGYSLVKINNKQFNYATYWCNKADSLLYIPELSKYIRDEIQKGQKSK